jgi:hypothetical protein
MRESPEDEDARAAKGVSFFESFRYSTGDGAVLPPDNNSDLPVFGVLILIPQIS